MTATIPKLFDSEDVGAPVITANDPQSVLQCLKTCLVGDSGGVAYNGKDAAGWTAEFEDVVEHKLVIKQGSGNQRLLRFGEPEQLAGNNWSWARQIMMVRGYESMTDIDTGTGQWPLVGQRALNSLYWCWAAGGAAYTNQTGPIPWTIIADDQFFYVRFQASQYGGNYTMPTMYWFGDIEARSTLDTHNTVLQAHSYRGNDDRRWDNAGYKRYDPYHYGPFYMRAWNETYPDMWVPKSYLQFGDPTSIGMHHLSWHSTDRRLGGSSMPLIDPVTNSFNMSRVMCHEVSGGNYAQRGFMPGLYASEAARPFEDMYKISGEGDQAGMEFITIRSRGTNRPSYYDTWCVFIRLDHWRD